MDFHIENISGKDGTEVKLLQYKSFDINRMDENLLTIKERLEIRKFRSQKRQAEFYFTRVLWKFFGIPGEINYDEGGRPFPGIGHLSISHSRDLVLIGYHPVHPVGVDVEYMSPKIKLIREKFIRFEDRQLIDFNSELDLTLVWSIKEAVFKMERIPGLSFAENIHVKMDASVPTVEVLKGHERHRYTFSFERRNDFVITCCTHASLNGVTLF